jgi:hypothetical protein
MLPPAQKECQDTAFYVGFTLTQFRHRDIQIPQWRPVRLISKPQLVTTEERSAFHALLFIRPPDSGVFRDATKGVDHGTNGSSSRFGDNPTERVSGSAHQVCRL